MKYGVSGKFHYYTLDFFVGHCLLNPIRLENREFLYLLKYCFLQQLVPISPVLKIKCSLQVVLVPYQTLNYSQTDTIVAGYSATCETYL